MIDVDVTRLSSKGQIVIPQDMRSEFDVGDKFVILKRDHEFILKPLEDVGRDFEEDFEFAQRTMKALEEYEGGGFRKMSERDFLADLEKW
ncbi:MAG TPA: AbrB/MazE/SpoVT family DNA-binding domain-containing protein [Candidatus Altiarchaeales archaeon]|nr:AbrB/MazE/SpoVT family DNA-binding domain-containing protein [Candidatus Altiarchaeales archaeon]